MMIACLATETEREIERETEIEATLTARRRSLLWLVEHNSSE